MISKLRHTGIVVRNLEQAIVFYEALGFNTWKREIEQGLFLETVVGLEGACVETAKLKAPCGALLELLQYNGHPVQMEISPQPSNQLGCSHIALTVGSIDEMLECVQNQGGSIVNPPSTAPNGKVRVAYCHDPEVNLIELVEELVYVLGRGAASSGDATLVGHEDVLAEFDERFVGKKAGGVGAVTLASSAYTAATDGCSAVDEPDKVLHIRIDRLLHVGHIDSPVPMPHNTKFDLPSIG